MSYTPTIWANGKAPALNADNLNKIENELAKLDNDVSTIEGELSSLAEVVEKPDITTTTSTTMPNSYSGRLKVDEIVGECQQESTAGNQLWNGKYVTTALSEEQDNFVANLTMAGNLYMPITVGMQYSFSVNGVLTPMRYRFLDASKNSLTNLENKTTTIVAPENAVFLNWRAVDYHAESDKCMLNEGTTALPYEPYTNGASPNPSYPQEIKSVKGFKNLLDCRGLAKQTKNGVTFTPMYDDGGNLLYINVNGTTTTQTDYVVNSGMTFGNTEELIFSTQAKGSDSTIFAFVSTDGQLAQCNDVEKRFTPLSGSTVYTCHIRVRANQTISNMKIYPMIRKASIADSTYVPYGMWGVKVRGKNLFNANSTGVKKGYYLSTSGGEVTSAISSISDYVDVRNFDNVFLSYSGSNTGMKVVGYYDKDKVFVSYGEYTNDKLLPVGNYAYIRFTYVAEDESLVMLNEGTTALPYEPYTESTIALSTELYGIGDVKDVIEGGKVKRRFKKIRILSSWNWSLSTLTGRFFAVTNIGITMGYQKEKPNALCTHFVCTTKGDNYTDMIFSFINETAEGVAIRHNALNGDIDAFKAFLDENEVWCVWELAEPTTEELPIADQIALNSIKTYDGITYLEFDSEIEPTFKGEYGTSKVGGYTLEGMLASRNGELYGKNYVDRITALEATVVNNI